MKKLYNLLAIIFTTTATFSQSCTKIIGSLLLLAIFSLGTFAQDYSKLSDYPEHIRKTKPFKRFEWYFQQRAFPYDTLPFYHANEVFSAELKKKATLYNQYKGEITRNPKGPFGVQATGYWSDWGIVSGRVRAIAVHPMIRRYYISVLPVVGYGRAKMVVFPG